LMASNNNNQTRALYKPFNIPLAKAKLESKEKLEHRRA